LLIKTINVNKYINFNNKENYINYGFFIIFFIVCWKNLIDFGVTLDDEIYYTNAVKTYQYVKSFFLSFTVDELNIEKYRADLKEWPIIFELLIVFICDILNINKIDEIYYVSHQVNFIIFSLSLLCFQKIIFKRFNNLKFSFISLLFFIISPRIITESFYNTRDIFFMSLFIFYIYFLYGFIENKSYSNIIKLSLFSALLINTKILGIIPIGIFCIIYLYNFLNTKKKFLKEINLILLFLLFTLLTIYVSWPYLWSNPAVNLYIAFRNILEVHENLIVVNFYFGEYIQSNLTPWHYRIVWFLISTPLIILILFFLGFIYISYKLIQILKNTLNQEYTIQNKNIIDLFLLLIFIASFFIVIEFNKSKFGGWRHLYFLYPIVIYFSIHAIDYFYKKNIKRIYKIFLTLLIILNSSYNLLWIYNNHPHQYIYFNLINKKYYMNNFDLDWWGISHKAAIDYILANDDSEKIKISSKGFTSLRNTFLFLSEKNKSRVIISDINNAKYIIDNKIKRLRNYEDVNKKLFFKFYVIKVNEQAISDIYKRRN
jgi:hypothetical protein